ncbi:hypothetical protein PIB30_087957 [Stylosanthes scabra]|uniref:Glycosyltransferase n=1 Tax=Stylosanthes scabra TaxID=79078 RepID=A0ABU6ZS96_9FABA|nr:hypothetical protein [Stylosanthes scabra]
MEYHNKPRQQQQSLEPLVVMMPSPGKGHLIPLIEFSKKLTKNHDLGVTIVIPSNDPPTAAETTMVRDINHIFLPPVPLSDLPSTPKVELLISYTIHHSLPSIRRALQSIAYSSRHRITAFVVDLFGTEAFDISSELNIPSYIFFTSTSMFLSFFFQLPHWKATQCESDDSTKLVQIPGCVPIHMEDLADGFKDDEILNAMIQHAKRFRLAQGIIENSFLELEPGTIKELQNVKPGRPPIYPVGPLANMVNDQTKLHGNNNDHECLRWLDEQPCGSVLFVCFGSGGTLSSAQIVELALGLEMSEQRFLWVIKSPNDKVSSGSFFNVNNNILNDPLNFLPKGFVERTKGKGLVVSNWAPQAQVLAHESIGGFLTHCGWNSILESVVNGVSLIAWPLYAEQKMNAVLVTRDMKVGLRPKIGEEGLVEREEIGIVVKMLMEGEEGKKLRHRMKELREAAIEVVGENGSSTKQIEDLALMWKNG